ncbi:MAG: hypothetical protein P9X22_08355 [Candidatus Zapsychrus exili]|nr:hypothetical protein [Candidatus Zapsychrus exili]
MKIKNNLENIKTLFLTLLIALLTCLNLFSHIKNVGNITNVIAAQAKIPPVGYAYYGLKKYLKELNIRQAGFITDRISANAGEDVVTMSEYQSAQYALSPTLLDYFNASNHQFMILKLFNPKNESRMLKESQAESIKKLDNGIILIKQKGNK